MTKKCSPTQRRYNWSWLLIAIASVLLVVAPSQGQAQQYFKSPEDATAALIAAAKADSANSAIAILGPQGRDIVSSGDQVADKNARARFLAAYDVKRQITPEGDSKAILVIGADDWPFPIPVVRSDKGWHFDAVAGRQEILFRRIGRNERNAIQASLAYVDAQTEYAVVNPQKNAIPVYAQRVVSRAGRKDGLYWPAKDGEAKSPLGEFFAAAAREGYQPGKGKGRAPYHGYHYKILKGQGPAAQGGAYDYVVRGKMIGGFALVAYPAEYRNAGVMTFIVNHEGTVFQKDLGPRTPRIASRMKAFNPDKTWQKVNLESVTIEKAK